MERPIENEELRSVIEPGDLAAVIDLVSRGRAVTGFDDLGKTPLHYAVERGHLGIASLGRSSRANALGRTWCAEGISWGSLSPAN